MPKTCIFYKYAQYFLNLATSHVKTFIFYLLQVGSPENTVQSFKVTQWEMVEGAAPLYVQEPFLHLLPFTSVMQGVDILVHTLTLECTQHDTKAKRSSCPSQLLCLLQRSPSLLHEGFKSLSTIQRRCLI